MTHLAADAPVAVRRSSGGLRRDIQGLRALAVTVVVLDHLFGWPGGGFLGVDVFFVISGFLITGLLLREHERTGHISFTAFYRRRARRILPASLVVLAVAVAWSWFIFEPRRWHATWIDAVWAALFGANWRFESLATNYFTATGPQSPFQHYWSLSVEEQFYFVWPWLMLAIFIALRKLRRHAWSHGLILSVMAAVTLVSFAYAVDRSVHAPAGAYFSTFTRIWELGAGAVLAIIAPLCSGLPRWTRAPMAWVGLLTILGSVFWINDGLTLPAPWGAVPVLGTCLVIAAGAGDERAAGSMFPLTNPVSGYLGDISYSLYVWHYPVIIIGLAEWGTGRRTQALLLVLAGAAAMASYHLLESPIHRRQRLSRAGGLVGVAAVALAMAVVSTAVALAPRPEPGIRVQASGATAGPASDALRTQIVSALAANSWPSDLSPSIDDVISGPESAADLIPCGMLAPPDLSHCTFGDPSATHTAVIVGDSVSMTYATALRAVFAQRPGWRFVVLGMFGCSFGTVPMAQNDAPVQNACPARNAQEVATVRALRPDVVFTANVVVRHQRLDHSVLSPQEFAASTAGLLAQLASSARHIVLLSAPPADKNIGTCFTRTSAPADCISTVSSLWLQQAKADQLALRSFGGIWVDSRAWFCVDDLCPAFVGTTPTKTDAHHMSVQYALKIAPAIEETLIADGVLQR